MTTDLPKAAIEAAARKLVELVGDDWDNPKMMPGDLDDMRDMAKDTAKAALTAALPHIERAVRQAVIEELRMETVAACYPSLHADGPVSQALRDLRDRLIERVKPYSAGGGA